MYRTDEDVPLRRSRRCKLGKHLASTFESDCVFCVKCGAFYGRSKERLPCVAGWGSYTQQKDLYRHTLSSARWKSRRLRRIEDTGGSCENCGIHSDRLELHHTTYARLGHEKDEDLILLCRKCHKEKDLERRHKPWFEAMLHVSIDTWIYGRDGEPGYMRGSYTLNDVYNFAEYWREQRGFNTKITIESLHASVDDWCETDGLLEFCTNKEYPLYSVNPSRYTFYTKEGQLAPAATYSTYS